MSESEQTQDQLFSGRFEDFGLSDKFHLGLKDLGYLKPTIVQRQVYAKVQEGHDLVVQSRTGSGKTTAFCLPVLTRLNPDQRVVQAIILVPTRELARQVATESSRLGHHAGLTIAAIYGGASFNAQIAALNAGAQLVVGTPGRVKDLLDRGHLKLENVAFAVLDEADEMLSMGFWDDVTYILRQLRKERQTLLFSATLPDAISSQLPQIVKDPIHLNLSNDNIGVKTIRHVFHIEDDTQPKARNLLHAIEFHHPQSSIVFCNTKEETEVIERYLRRFGFQARALNGDMAQSARETVMKEMRDGRLDLIVATDVAARGIDISGITHVFNFELPHDSEVYVHRTGRTGRIGKLGVAVNLVRAKDVMQIDELKQKFSIEFEEVALPPEADILWMQAERLATLFVEAADSVEISQYRQIGESLLGRADLSEIIAFLLRSHFSQSTPKPAPSRTYPEESHNKRQVIEKPKPIKQKVQISPVKSTVIAPLITPKPIEVIASDSDIDADADSDDEHADFAEDILEVSYDSEGATRLYITLGRDDGFKELTELALYIAETSKVDFGFFTGMGQMRDTSSHVEVENEIAEKIISTFNEKDRDMARAKGANAGNPKILCEVANGTDKKPRPRRFKRN